MKKRSWFALTLCLALLLGGCSRAAEAPAYPLEEAAVVQAFKDGGFDAEISEEETTRADNKVVYTLRSTAETYDGGKQKVAAFVTSAKTDSGNYLRLTLPVDAQAPSGFRLEDWKKQLQLAAQLYGSLERADALYDALCAAEISSDSDSIWTSAAVSGCFCLVRYHEASAALDIFLFQSENAGKELLPELFP